jgi:hypothetical protein
MTARNVGKMQQNPKKGKIVKRMHQFFESARLISMGEGEEKWNRK